MGQDSRYDELVNQKNTRRHFREVLIMNENMPCTTSTGLQTFTGALFVLALALALTLIALL